MMLIHEYIGPQPEPRACQLFLQLWSGIVYLHTRWVCHRDIKPDNIMLDRQGHIKLTDFGFARRVDPKEYAQVPPGTDGRRLWFADEQEEMEAKDKEALAKSYSYCGTPAYEARELLLEQPYDPFLADIWSMNVVLYMIVPFMHTLHLSSYILVP